VIRPVLLLAAGACAVALAGAARAESPPARKPGEATLAAQLELLDLLRGHEFAELSRRVEAEQARFEADPVREPVTNQMWSTFEISDPALGPAIDAWAAEVRSYAPQTAKGLYHRRLAWAARGGEWAALMSRAQVAEMQEHADVARACFQRALELHPKLMIAYSGLLDLAKDGTIARERKRLLARAVAVCPSCLTPRREYLMSRTPRRGGSYGEMYAYLTEISQEIARYPRLRLLEGVVALERALEARDSRGDHAKAVLFLDEALRHGNYWAYRSERCKALDQLGRYTEALADCEYWLAHGTLRGDALIWKADALRRLDRVAEATTAIELAQKLDPTNRILQAMAHGIEVGTADVSGSARVAVIGVVLAVSALAAFAALAAFRRVRASGATDETR
jgi:tetratricopeptide (TPR) repeat protein